MESPSRHLPHAGAGSGESKALRAALGHFSERPKDLMQHAPNGLVTASGPAATSAVQRLLGTLQIGGCRYTDALEELRGELALAAAVS